ncbi:hypothetical protein SDRG_16400 [Saprolegnia diclina VS20]|uniref:Uncharacterized protein n=1 Tax=Saprolegnia diclina (strain VS20) TaxID=1156394 RepID=T0PK28_SAPDV|nr:hypothetical protein SDRG_16400 [Saprolegnia diclina VS20]EQC25739.1 hypothetical protein SDRG_16400 [Saprolegnia diclina VS20]|eukprot:XP_008620831.1 hypothetical protein SDRG_16400 [Saprolegnia diclina VS20]
MASSRAVGPTPPSRGTTLLAAAGRPPTLSKSALSSIIRLAAVPQVNDRWWAGFHGTGHEAFLIDLLNTVLATTTTTTAFTLLPTYARCAVLTDACYVDFAATFEVAHTLSRQARCKQIASLASVRMSTSLPEKIRYWERHFQLQWQPGTSEIMLVQNALGMQQLVTVKNLAQKSGPWTSLDLRWMPLNDLANGHELNRRMSSVRCFSLQHKGARDGWTRLLVARAVVH